MSLIFRCSLSLLLASGMMSVYSIHAQGPSGYDPDEASAELSADELKKLSLEELLNVEVVSVSKRPEKLNETASAIQVITYTDIRNSGVKTLPEALRLASNLHVAQVNSSQWAISARGFNNVLANKMLVLIDGRVIYTPMYAGVFWDVQNILLEDVDRIEVISGPGGTLWGANAVNGVINIITKHTAETRGLFAEGAIGNHLPGLGSIRYGGKLNDALHFRIYGTGFKLDNTIRADGSGSNDNWSMIKGGFRLDFEPSIKNKVILLSDIYGANPNTNGTEKGVEANGDHVVAQWNHTPSETSQLQVKAFYDHTWRDFNTGFTEDLKTYDLELQSQHRFGDRHLVTGGVNLRMMDHAVTNLELFGFFPGNKTLYIYSLFVQEEFMLIQDRLKLTIGSKLEHHTYTGLEYQPNGRLTWLPAKSHTVWAAASRAVRTPSRIDRDFAKYANPDLVIIAGTDGFISEEMIAYELGWRSQLLSNLSMSLSTFYNVYDNLRSAEPGPPPLNFPITFQNGVEGTSYGVELSAVCQLNSWWRLRGGYTFFNKDLSVKPESRDLNQGTAESNDPAHQFLIQSHIELPGRIDFGLVLRSVDQLPKPPVPAYTALDLRIGWKLNKNIELNIVGQNLLSSRHAEFIPAAPAPSEIEQGIYGKVIFRMNESTQSR